MRNMMSSIEDRISFWQNMANTVRADFELEEAVQQLIKWKKMKRELEKLDKRPDIENAD